MNHDDFSLLPTKLPNYFRGLPLHEDDQLNNFTFNPVIFLLSLEADKVHAPLPAVVPGIEPVPLGVPNPRVTVLPAKPVVTAIELVHACHLSP